MLLNTAEARHSSPKAGALGGYPGRDRMPAVARKPSQPDHAARFLSHLVVGLVAGALVGKRSGFGSFLAYGLVAAALHEALDAPVAGVLSDLGT